MKFSRAFQVFSWIYPEKEINQVTLTKRQRHTGLKIIWECRIIGSELNCEGSEGSLGYNFQNSQRINIWFEIGLKSAQKKWLKYMDPTIKC